MFPRIWAALEKSFVASSAGMRPEDSSRSRIREASIQLFSQARCLASCSVACRCGSGPTDAGGVARKSTATIRGMRRFPSRKDMEEFQRTLRRSPSILTDRPNRLVCGPLFAADPDHGRAQRRRLPDRADSFEAYVRPWDLASAPFIRARLRRHSTGSARGDVVARIAPGRDRSDPASQAGPRQNSEVSPRLLLRALTVPQH